MAEPDLVPRSFFKKLAFLTGARQRLPGGLPPLGSGTILVNGSLPRPADPAA